VHLGEVRQLDRAGKRASGAQDRLPCCGLRVGDRAPGRDQVGEAVGIEPVRVRNLEAAGSDEAMGRGRRLPGRARRGRLAQCRTLVRRADRPWTLARWSPAERTSRALEGADQIGRDPAAVEVAVLGLDALVVEPAGVHPRRVERDVRAARRRRPPARGTSTRRRAGHPRRDTRLPPSIRTVSGRGQARGRRRRCPGAARRWSADARSRAHAARSWNRRSSRRRARSGRGAGREPGPAGGDSPKRVPSTRSWCRSAPPRGAPPARARPASVAPRNPA